MVELRVYLQFCYELPVMLACTGSDTICDPPHLLRQLCRFHLRFDNLEREHLSGRFAALISLCAMADGEAAFAQSRAGRIVCSMWLRYDGWWGFSVYGRHVGDGNSDDNGMAVLLPLSAVCCQCACA